MHFRQNNVKSVNLFFPYISCDNDMRQREIDLCLRNNVENCNIDRIFLFIDELKKPPLDSPKLEIIYLNCKPTYKLWIEETQRRKLQGISILANSDIYLDSTVACLDEIFTNSNTFLSLSCWDQIGDYQIPHPNPQCSQDVWGINCEDEFSPDFLRSLDFGMDIPRCDNKIAYLFAVRGWTLSNPYAHLKSIHVHMSNTKRDDREFDLRIVGGVAYVHPCENITDEAVIDIQVWTTKSTAIKSISVNKYLEDRILENQFGAVAKLPNAHQVTAATSHELLSAVHNGESVYKEGYEFEVLKDGNIFFFKNHNELVNAKKIIYLSDNVDQSLSMILAPGFIPSVITTHSTKIRNRGTDSVDLNFWQYPCATEKQAYENHLIIPIERFIDYENKVINTYLPLPWATYIDKGDCPKALLVSLKQIIMDYRGFAELSGFQLRVHTVCQHIHWRRVIRDIHDVGVTDLHLSHKCSNGTDQLENQTHNVQLHCWPLIAVNYVSPGRNNNLCRKPIADKKLLASFIGAQMPHYRDESRVELMNAANGVWERMCACRA